MGLYHRENAQEDFLVLAGECLLIVEGEERKLKTWDFFHCPPGTEHIIVGAGKEPAVVLAVGARGRRRKGLVYPVSEAALKHKAGVEKETTRPVRGVRQLRGLEALALPGRLAARPLARCDLLDALRLAGARCAGRLRGQLLVDRLRPEARAFVGRQLLEGEVEDLLERGRGVRADFVDRDRTRRAPPRSS